MTIIKIEEIITPYEIVVNKLQNQLTMIDVFSLIIHMTKKFADGSSDISISMHKYYYEFIDHINIQNEKGWPRIISLKNDFFKRIDGVVGKSHENTNNMLGLLIRLVHLEREKEVPLNGSMKKILDYNISETNNSSVRAMTVADLLALLRRYMNYYVSVYCDPTRFENVLGHKIINHIK